MNCLSQLHETHPLFMGRMYALLAGLSNALMAISFKYVTPTTKTSVVASVNASIGICISFAVFSTRGYAAYHPGKIEGFALFLRGLLGSACFVVFNLGMRLLPAPKMIVINNMQVIWVTILAPFLLKEYPTKMIIFLVCLCFFGVVLLVDPSFVLPNYVLSLSGYEIEAERASVPLYYYLMPVATGLAAAMIGIFMMAFSQTVSVFHNSAIFFIFALLYAGIWRTLTDEKGDVPPVLSDYLIMFSQSLFTNGFQVFFSLASKYEKKASIVSMLMSSQVLFTFILDYFLLGNKSNILNLIGAGVVLGTAFAITLQRETKREEQEKRESMMSHLSAEGELYGCPTPYGQQDLNMIVPDKSEHTQK